MLYGLKWKEQCQVIDTAQTGKPFSECPVQSEGAKKFYNSLVRQMKELPGVRFDYPEMDEIDPESEALEEIMFKGMPLK